jgi:hypothetical protein
MTIPNNRLAEVFLDTAYAIVLSAASDRLKELAVETGVGSEIVVIDVGMLENRDSEGGLVCAI